jgi:DNA polymerase zeta
VNSAIRNLHLSIDHALAVSYRRNAYDGKTAYVAHISLVKGIPFYGYHVGYRFYFKIYLLNPLNITRLADLLRQGAVLKRPLQPYESHLQYIPQWMCDFNLYGCAYMDCAKVKFRSPVPNYLELTNLAHRWHDRSIPSDLISNESDLPKQSHCSLEVDVCVQNITNRLAIQERPLHHDFIERMNPLSPEEKLVHSMAGLWQDETRRRKRRLGIKDPGSSPFGPEELIPMSASPRDQNKGGWIHEEEFWDRLHEIAAEENQSGDETTISFENYVRRNPLEGAVKTALESVEDLFPQKLESLNHEANDLQDGADTGIQIDENTVLSLESDDRYSYSDDDLSDEPGFAFVEDDPALNDLSGSDSQTHEESLKEHDNSSDSNNDSPKQRDDNKRDFPRPGDLAHQRSLGTRAKETDAIRHARFDTNALSRPQKRSDDEEIDSAHVAKRSRHLNGGYIHDDAAAAVDTGNLSFDISAAFEDDTVRTNEHSSANGNVQTFSQQKPSSSQRTLPNRASSQNQRLSFPVVKDPNDPMTVLRFSQKSVSSKPATQLSQATEELSAQEYPKEPEARLSSQLESTASDSTLPDCDANVLQIASNIYDAFQISGDRKILCYRYPSPSPSEIAATINAQGRPTVIYQKAYYSDESDVPERQREYAGREFRLGSNTLQYLPEFDRTGRSPSLLGDIYPLSIANLESLRKQDEKLRDLCSCRIWEFAQVPPRRSEVVEWFEMEMNLQKHNSSNGLPRLPETKPNVLSQIEGATQKDPHGFKYSQKQGTTSVEHQTQYMSVMSLEVHVNTRDALAPNPEEDEITCVFWSLQSDDEDLDVNSTLDGVHVGILAQSGSAALGKVTRALSIDIEQEPTELDLINRLVDIVRSHDPDILTGYEVHNSSWGYLIERARHKYDYDLCDELSRVKTQSHGRFGKENDRWGFNHTSTIRVTGRHMINIWRAMRSELNLLQYTMENVVFHLLHRRIPHYTSKDLTTWYKSDKPRDMMKVMKYFVSRTQMDLEILEANELIPRTSEQARLLGIDFFSVFSRGSQFKVESLMFRIAKPENFILISPSKKQVGQQNALECLPLVMEPQSDFYTSPLLVLDFQSLYPSVMIAYNYCYSTFLGRLVSWRGRNKMGFTDYERPPHLLELLGDKINIAPNGMMYVKPEIRKSLLARMLSEILETRVMVKAGMKVDKDDKILQRLLNNRQFALKLIANVTYGYTSASFSGRMPCSEIADSIVQTGRETLEKAIALIHSIERWGAEVVYGDTDSLFVYLKGRSRDEAFTIGEEIAKAVTKMNPRPVKLKFEKVYHPCVLLAKKRYVGFKYEHREQVEPEFDAKGIETVRRDGTPAEQKIEEKALKILFRTADLSQVKSYFQNQCSKIMQGKVSIQDFCFAREVRLGTYSDRGLLPPGALVSTKKMLMDPRLEPQYGERVPYVVVTGAPGSRLVDRCVAPEVLLHNPHLELDAEYYISKNIIPPLERIFNLVGANVRQWYDEMPKVQRIRRIEGVATGREAGSSKKTLESYMKSSACILCKEKLDDAEFPICSSCISQPHISFFTLTSRLQQAERRINNLLKICRSCMGVPFGDDVKCDSKDCPVFYSRTRDMANWSHSTAVLEPIIRILAEQSERALEW